MMFKSHFARNFQIKVLSSLSNGDPKPVLEIDHTKRYDILPAFHMVTLNTNMNVHFASLGVRVHVWSVCILLTRLLSVLLQYCGQPGVLLHHSHGGAVQQSE